VGKLTVGVEMIKENGKYERSDNCYLEELDDEILLYNPSKNITLHFNESSALIWKMLDGEVSVENIVTFLQEQYPEAKDQIFTDVITLLNQLLEEEAIILVSA